MSIQMAQEDGTIQR